MIYKRSTLTLLFFFLLAYIVSAEDKATGTEQAQAETKNVRPYSDTVYFKLPGAQIVEPQGETLEIEARQEKVKFSWKPGKTPYEVFAYLFKIYEDQNLTQKGEVFSEQVSGLADEIDVPADKLKDGQTYTVSVKQINNLAGKLSFSDPAARTFKVIIKK